MGEETMTNMVKPLGDEGIIRVAPEMSAIQRAPAGQRGDVGADRHDPGIEYGFSC